MKDAVFHPMGKKLAKRLISGYHSILLMSVAVRVTTGQYGHIKNQTKNQQ